MELRISEKLKALRNQLGNTQEELASFLGISAQSVSKWERDEGYPDITLLPRIAGYYHISVDELLGVDEIAKQERIDEITAKYNTLRHHIPLDKNYHLDEGIELIRNALRELPGVFFFEQLLASDLTWKAKNSDDQSEKTALFDEATILCVDIIARCTEQRWRLTASEILLVIYAELGKTENALNIAYSLPGPFTTCEYMLTYILKDEALIKQYKHNAVLYYKIFRECIEKMNDCGIPVSDMINQKELSVHGIGEKEYIDMINRVLN